MAESPYRTIPQQPLPPDTNLDSLQQDFAQPYIDDMPPLQQSATGSFGLFTPQATRSLAYVTRSPPVCEVEEQPMSQNLAASAHFIHTTSILKASFLKTSTPSMGEIIQLAAQTGFNQYTVSTWFDIIRDLKRNDGAIISPTPEATQAILPRQSDFNMSENFPPPTDSNIVRTMDPRTRPLQTEVATRLRSSSSGNSHPSKRQRKGQSSQSRCTTLTLNDQPNVSRGRPSKALEHKQYRCPTCKSQTGTMDDWYTHQTRTHFPS